MAAPSVDDLAASFELYLRAGNKSRRTIETYREALDGFCAHLQATSKRSLGQARREDVEAWMTVLLARWKPGTAHNRYRGLHAFYRWLEEEEDIPSPMARMRPPAVPEQPVPVLGEEQLRTLFAVCAGKDFDARRDTALLMMLLDAGPRRSELLGMRLADIDPVLGVVIVRGKGGRQRALPMATRPRWRSTVTCARCRATGSRTWTRCGLGGVARSPPPASATCSAGVLGRPASQSSIRTCSVTPSRMPGSEPAATRPT
jgi:site-specific recombinase XerD